MSIAENNNPNEAPRDMLQDYLNLQRQPYAPSAVEEFSQWHEQDHSNDDGHESAESATGELAPGHEHAQAKHYRELIPVGMPGDEEQFAFEVDLSACSGCKSCVAACHNLNGLEDEEMWREVGMLQSEGPFDQTDLPVESTAASEATQNSLAVIQHVTSACHHCDDPGCLNGCPVKAYEKDPLTGIVRHLDDQCIGCQYCTLMCPYEVPRYSEKLGIVRKCDMCHQRLAVGQAPACVQACPNEAIRISIVSRSDILDRAAKHQFLPDSPPTTITSPSTVYRNAEHLSASASRADVAVDKPQHSHFPLAAMLVVTQMSVGLFIVDRLLATFATGDVFGDAIHSAPQALLRIIALVVTLAGVHIAPLHLGRPMYAFRAFLNFRTSWLSREIIAFGKHMGAASLYAVATTIAWLGFFDVPPIVITALGWATVLTGVAGVCCSAMVYVATQRPAWSAAITFRKFLLSSCALGPSAAVTLMMSWNLFSGEQLISQTVLLSLTIAAVIGIAVRLVNDGLFMMYLKTPEHTMLKRTALLMRDQLTNATIARFALSSIAMLLVMVSFFVCKSSSPVICVALPALAIGMLVAGELVERWLFFTSVIPFRMPGIQP